MIIVDEHISLRPWKASDRDALAFHGSNKKIADNMTDAFPFPYTADDADDFITMVGASDPPNIIAIVVDQIPCGGIGIHLSEGLHRNNAEMGYWIGEKFWNRGIISKVIPHMVKYAFEHWEINRIFARPFGRNVASQKVLEKSGFLLEAEFKNTLIKNGVKEDELVYAIRKNP